MSEKAKDGAQTLHILVVDDNPGDLRLAEAHLEDSQLPPFTVDLASSFDEGRKALLSKKHDIALLDYRLDTHDGLELLRVARAHGCDFPIIMLTGLNDRDTDLAAQTEGASDYLLKSQLSPELLERSIRYALEAQRVARERQHLEAQLRQAQKMEAIGTLAGGIAHDFNNLLGAILGYAELVQSSLDPKDPLVEDMEQIVGAAERGGALTRQLLAFSRRQVLKTEIFDLNLLLSNLRRLLGRLIRENVKLHLDLAPSPCPVRADRNQVEQIIINLVINACDAMPQGGELRLESRFHHVSKGMAEGEEVPHGDWVCLSVSDTGLGMDPEICQRVFEPFFTTKELGKGTGLGLSTVWGIVHQSEGLIRIDSTPGTGTTVSVHLPRQLLPPPATMLRPVVDDDPLRGSGCVLLAEDEDALRSLLRKVLERRGYTVFDAPNAEVALKLVEEGTCEPDLLLTDIVMPSITGVELAKRLRNRFPELCVLYMTGYSDNALTRKNMELDAPLISKPFKTRRLLEILRSLRLPDRASSPGV